MQCPAPPPPPIIPTPPIIRDSRVPTEKFIGDLLEERFGKITSLNRRNDKPSLYLLDYSENIVRIRRSITQVNGNTKGKWGNKKKISWEKVDEVPLEKRKKQKNVDHRCRLKLLYSPFILYIFSYSVYC